MLSNLVPRLDRSWDTVQSLHDSLHIQNRVLEVTNRPSLMEFRGWGQLSLKRDRFLEEFAGGFISLLQNMQSTLSRTCVG